MEETKIAEGVEFHDKGFFKEAIKCYDEVLQLNPDNVHALYEMSYSYFQMGDQENSLKYSMRGMQYKSDLLSQFYMNAGNSLDILGKPEQAIAIYKKAIAIDPGQNMFYYNMGIAYLRLEEPEQARKNFIESIRRNPDHASSHYALADMYIKDGEQIPAILLLCRFLIIEPNSERSLVALDRLIQVMSAGVKQEDEKNITINLFPADSDEADVFQSIEMLYKLSRATRYLEENKNKSAVELRLDELSALFSYLDKEKLNDDSSYIEKYLITYFSELARAGQQEAFVYYIHQAWDNESVQQWLRENWPRTEAFKKWKQQYSFNIK
jgi:tetratricopeptide (TPR) repeat protein